VKEFHDSSIQKCLSFSSADMSDRFKRSSVASNSSSSSYVSQSRIKNGVTKGSLEMKITVSGDNQKKIEIHGECGKVLNFHRTSCCVSKIRSITFFNFRFQLLNARIYTEA